MTIRVRLTAWYAAVGAITLAILGIVVWLQYAGALRASLDEVLRAQAGAVREMIEAAPADTPDVGPLERGLFVIVFDPAGTVRFASPGAPTVPVPTPGSSSVETGRVGRDALYAEAAGSGRTVVAGSSLAGIDRSLESLVRTMLVVGAVGAIVLIAGGWWLAGRALAPVAEITRAADRIGSSDLGQRITEPARDDELGALARTLNRMLGRLEESARRQRAFVLGASHDLRTPLSSLRTELELAMAGPADQAALLAAVEGAHGDAVHLSELANGLLRLAAAEPDGRPMDRVEVGLRDLVADAVRVVERTAAERHVTIATQVPDLTVRADRMRLEQALVNLLSNAVRFAPEETAVEVTATIDGDGETDASSRVLRIQVLDRGPGVAADVRDSLFEPFARSRAARAPGSGLGLATAAGAIHAHGGAIGYDDRPGGGATFWFWVPA